MQYLFLSIYSTSSKLVFIAVSDFGAWKKIVWNLSTFPTTLRQRSHPTPEKALKIKFPTPRAQRIVKCPGVGMLKFRFDRFVISSRWKFDRYVFRCTAKCAFRFAWQNFLDFTFYNSIVHFCVFLCIRWRLYSNISQCLISWGKTFSSVNWYGILRTSWPSSVSISLPTRRFEETRVSSPKYESAKNVCVRSKVIVRKVYFTNLELLASFFSLNGCEIMLFHRHREIVLLMTMMILITRDLTNPTKKRQWSVNSRIQQG